MTALNLGQGDLFAVRMEARPAKGKFQTGGLTGDTPVRVIGQDRMVETRDGQFEDDFGPRAVHLYEFSNRQIISGGPLEITGRITSRTPADSFPRRTRRRAAVAGALAAPARGVECRSRGAAGLPCPARLRR